MLARRPLYTISAAVCFNLLVGQLAWTATARAQCDPQELAQLIPPDGQSSDHAGYAIALDADTAIVGAYGHNLPGKANAGAAYVFVRAGGDGSWVFQQKLTASDAAADASFGLTIALRGDTALVGAYSAGGTAGSAYIFTRSGSVWTQQGKLTATDATAGDLFGCDIRFAGDSIVVGARAAMNPPLGRTGAVYVFEVVSGQWAQQAKLVADDAASGTLFGSVLGLADDDSRLVVGDSRNTHSGLNAAGAVYIFERSGTQWVQQAKLIAADPVSDARFGIELGLDGDTLAVGASSDSPQGVVDAGSVYIFQKTGTTWVQQYKLTASDVTAGDFFGASISLAGDLLAIGAPFDSYAGRSYVSVPFTSSTTAQTGGWKPTSSWPPTPYRIGTSAPG